MKAGTAQIVAIAGDPGGAAAVAPVLELLRQQGRPLRALAYQRAVGHWRSRGLQVDELPNSTNLEQARRCLGDAGLLLSATSFNGLDLEKTFITAARYGAIPSVAVLDHWANYRLRFADERGELVYCPDRIAVMDEQARAEMVAEGFERDRLVVTGQPAFDDLATFRRSVTPQRRQAVRQRLGVGEDEHLVLFASEPIATVCGTRPSDPLYPGYTEHTVLRAVARALERIGERHPQKIVLLVRPHPLDKPEDFDLTHHGPLRLLMDRQTNGREVVMAADVVAGMTTILLVEACFLGCVVVSLQPRLRLPDVLPTNRWGVSRAVLTEPEIEPALEGLLFDAEARRNAIQKTTSLQLEPDAAGRVVRLLDSLLSSPGANGKQGSHRE